MLAARRHCRLVALWAIWAVLFGALAPTLARAALAGSGSTGAIEVCTSTGMLWVQDDAAAQPDDGSTAADAQKKCTWCSMHPVLALPVGQSSPALLPRLQEMPVAFYRAGPMPAVWLGARPRAPPPLRG